MEIKMISYCGIDCLKCDSYIATQSGNYEELVKVAENLTKLYQTEVKPEYIICDGCRTGERHSYFCSNLCKMRNCCIEQGFYSCIECADFACEDLQKELDHVPNAMENLQKLKK